MPEGNEEFSIEDLDAVVAVFASFTLSSAVRAPVPSESGGGGEGGGSGAGESFTGRRVAE